MQAQLSLYLNPDPAPTYAQRGTNVLQTIFKEHFPDFADSYKKMYTPTYGRFRLERITEVAENFMLCADYTKGIARSALPVHRNAPLSLLNTWRMTFYSDCPTDWAPSPCPKLGSKQTYLRYSAGPFERSGKNSGRNRLSALLSIVW